MCLKCDLGLSDSDYMDYLRAKIQDMGWIVQGVEDGSVVYTVGMAERGMPELLLRGVDELEAAAGRLNALADRQLKAGAAFEAGQVTQVEGRLVRLEDAPAELALVAGAVYPELDVSVLELGSLS